MYLKIFGFNFWEQFGDSLYRLFKSLFEVFTLVVIFLIVWGIVCVPFVVLYLLIVKISELIFKIDIDFLKYIALLPILSFICTVLLLIFVL